MLGSTMDPLALVSYIFQKYFSSTMTRLTPRIAYSIFLRWTGAIKVIINLETFKKKMVTEDSIRVNSDMSISLTSSLLSSYFLRSLNEKYLRCRFLINCVTIELLWKDRPSPQRSCCTWTKTSHRSWYVSSHSQPKWWWWLGWSTWSVDVSGWCNVARCR